MIEKLLGTQASLSTGFHPLCCELVLKMHFSGSPKIKLLRVERSPPPSIALYLAPHSLRSVEDSPYFFLSRLLDNF